jgi:UDP-GlcNAc3NAcA epimerase
MPYRVMSIVGARPQFVKAAVTSQAMAALGTIEEQIIHTGQHYNPDMSDVFFDELNIPAPIRNLNISGGPHGEMTGRMIEAIEAVLIAERPDAVVVFGDTNSTLAGTLAAVKLGLPIFHIEAGLRSYRKEMPEEVNRIITDRLSALLLCPTRQAVENLKREGLTDGVRFVGDVMFDAVLLARREGPKSSEVLAKHGVEQGPYSIATLHRAESTASQEALESRLRYLSEQATGSRILFPVHPRTRLALSRYGLSTGPLVVLPPVSYLELQGLLDAAELVFTDSGGLQKEAYFHGKPCITLRDETEWTETVAHGWNRLWRTPDWSHPRTPIEDYGDGQAGEAIVREICNYLADHELKRTA